MATLRAMSSQEQSRLCLCDAPTGQAWRVAHLPPAEGAFAKARAMGLREGRSLEVLARNGRITLVRLSGARLAISHDLAKRITLQ